MASSMDAKTLKDFSTAVIALIAAVLSLFKYLHFKSRQEKLRLVRQAFDTVVESLASDSMVERLGGAILLRRFYDAKSEVGEAGTPYWKEAVSVTTAMLRGQRSGDFQKLLADGLAFAPTLERADLQKTNLQYAYLGARKIADGKPDAITNLSFGDFYRADLSGASLKRAKAVGAFFYQARMHNTVLTGADLRDASFFEADLTGAKFDGAFLQGAKFHGARNIPGEISERLEQGVFQQPEPVPSPQHNQAAVRVSVFISRPGMLTLRQEQQISALHARLGQEGISAQSLNRAEYASFGEVAEVRRLLSGCAGAVIFGFADLAVHKGIWRGGTPDQKEVAELRFPTSWSQMEAGMAIMYGLPMLVLRERNIHDGIFGIPGGDYGIYHVVVDDDWNAPESLTAFAHWCADVREQGRHTGQRGRHQGR
jgi:uncharacterized protein YjbI with pentapeptide repeats